MKSPASRIHPPYPAIVPGTASGWLRFGVNTHPKHAPPSFSGH